MGDRAIVLAALIIGGAVLASSFQNRARYAMSASGNFAWRMDTWSGNVDLCAVAQLPSGPLMRCGVFVVVPTQEDESAPQPAEPASEEGPLSPLAVPGAKTL